MAIKETTVRITDGTNLAGVNDEFDSQFSHKMRTFISDVEIGRATRNVDFYPENLNDRWTSDAKAFRAISAQREKNYKGRSDVRDLEFHRIVEAVVSDQYQTVFPDRQNWFDMRGRTGEVDEETAELQKKALSVLFQEAKYVEKMETFVRNRAIYGTAFAKFSWDFRREVRTAKEKVEVPLIDQDGLPVLEENGEPAMTFEIQRITKERTVYDGFDIQSFPIEDVYVEPRMKDIQAADQVYRHEVSAEWLKGKEELLGLLHLDEIFEAGGDFDTEVSKSPFRDEKRGIPDDTQFENLANQRNTFTLWEWWGWSDLPSSNKAQEVNDNIVTGEREQVQVWMVNNFIIYFRKNPFDNKTKPIIHAQWIRNEDSVYGIGIFDVAKSWFRAISDRINQHIDNVTAAMCNMWAVDVNRLDNVSQDFIFNQFKKIGTDGNPKEVIMPLGVPDLTGSSLSMIEFLSQRARESSGATDPKVGKASNVAATNFSIAFEEASKRFNLYSFGLEIEVVEKVILTGLEYAQQFFDEKRTVRITDPHVRPPVFVEVTPDDFYGFQTVDVVPLGVRTMQNRTLQVQNLVNVLNIGQNIPEFDPVPVLKLLWRALGQPDPDQIIRSPNTRAETKRKVLTENLLLTMQMFDADESDDHEVEIRSHEAWMAANPDEVTAFHGRHQAQHFDFLDILAEQEQGVTIPGQEGPITDTTRDQTQVNAQLAAPQPDIAPNRSVRGTAISNAPRP